MGQVKGQKEYKMFEDKKKLSLKQSVLANCYMCNGQEESSEDCKGSARCPLYPYSPHGRKLGLHSTSKQKERALKILKKPFARKLD